MSDRTVKRYTIVVESDEYEIEPFIEVPAKVVLATDYDKLAERLEQSEGLLLIARDAISNLGEDALGIVYRSGQPDYWMQPALLANIDAFLKDGTDE